MSMWWKGLLFGTVVLAHMAVIFGMRPPLHGIAPRRESYGPVLQVQFTSLVPVAQPQASAQATVSAISARIKPQAWQRAANDALATQRPPNKTSDTNEYKEHQHLEPEYFFSANEVDETANPLGNFEEMLRQGLPLFVHGLVIEFWIDSSGNTLQVRCVEGDCSEAMAAGFDLLLASFFQAAVKDGMAVPSRKLIQIDPSSML